MSPFWHLALLPLKLWDRGKRLWVYQVDFLDMSGGQSALESVPVTLGAGFVMIGLSALVTDTANPPLIIWPQTNVANSPANFLIQLTAVKAQRDFFSQLAPLDNVAGAGMSSPGIPVPYHLESGEVLNVRAQSMWAAATLRHLRLSIHGVLIL